MRWWWAKAAAYVLSLYTWWYVCSSYFEPEVVLPRAEYEANYGATPAASVLAANAVTEVPSVATVPPVEVTPPVIAEPQASGARSAGTKATSVVGASAASASAASALTAELPLTAAASDPTCPPGRRPFHTLLTAQGSIYNQWQARIMYHHWKKQRAVDGRCTEMSGFTRLCPSPDGKPDGVEAFIPTVFVAQLTPQVLAKYGHFGVLNRPHSVVEFFKDPALRARVTEEWVMIAETDHVLTKPMPNLASDTEAAAHSFGYMHAGSHHQKVVDLVNKETSWKQLQPIGPSPLIIKMTDLEKVAPRWLEYSYALRADPMPAMIIQDWCEVASRNLSL